MSLQLQGKRQKAFQSFFSSSLLANCHKLTYRESAIEGGESEKCPINAVSWQLWGEALTNLATCHWMLYSLET